MADSLKARVARMVAASVHALIDHIEDQNPGAAMEQSLREADGVIDEVRSAGEALNSAANQVNATAQSLSQAASEQAASVEETTTSIDDISSSITQNSDNARITDGMAGKASREASEGGTAVTQTVAAMKQVEGAARDLNDLAQRLAKTVQTSLITS